MKLYSEGLNAVIDLEDGNVGQPFPKRDGMFYFSSDGSITNIVNKYHGSPYPPVPTAELKDGTAETESTGTVTLNTGAAGSVDGITVNGVEIMSAAVPFNATLDQTALDVAANINNNVANTDYSASATGAVITITYLGVDKTDSNGFVVVSTVTTITSTDVNMAGGVSAVVGDYAAVLTYLAAILG